MPGLIQTHQDTESVADVFVIEPERISLVFRNEPAGPFSGPVRTETTANTTADTYTATIDLRWLDLLAQYLTSVTTPDRDADFGTPFSHAAADLAIRAEIGSVLSHLRDASHPLTRPELSVLAGQNDLAAVFVTLLAVVRARVLGWRDHPASGIDQTLEIVDAVARAMRVILLKIGTETEAHQRRCVDGDDSDDEEERHDQKQENDGGSDSDDDDATAQGEMLFIPSWTILASLLDRDAIAFLGIDLIPEGGHVTSFTSDPSPSPSPSPSPVPEAAFVELHEAHEDALDEIAMLCRLILGAGTVEAHIDWAAYRAVLTGRARVRVPAGCDRIGTVFQSIVAMMGYTDLAAGFVFPGSADA